MTSTRGRATQRGKRRQHEALRLSVWTSVLVFRGSDAMSECIRRMRCRSGHGAKNSHSTGTAGSQTCNARASRRPCDVHERACDAARQTPSARSFVALALAISACVPWLRCDERLHAAYEAPLRSRSQELALDRHSSITDVQRQSHNRRPCDVHERACDAARQAPSARSFAAISLGVGACIQWL